jgi:hypothetical protein
MFIASAPEPNAIKIIYFYFDFTIIKFATHVTTIIITHRLSILHIKVPFM